jgi:hypothetical protein
VTDHEGPDAQQQACQGAIAIDRSDPPEADRAGADFAEVGVPVVAAGVGAARRTLASVTTMVPVMFG